jgi:serine/threonine-protein kinase ULK/ATG1
MVGSPIYMAPEVLKGSSYTSKADVWSFGVVLYECLYGFCPYEDRSIGKLIKLIDNKDLYFPPVPKISRELSESIRHMLTINPSKRISWEGLLASPMFKEKPAKEDFTLDKLQDIEYYKSVDSPGVTSRSEE